MKVLTTTLSVPEEYLRWDTPSPADCLFFDIETTGLSWRRSHLYLLGAVYYENSAWTLRQWFCQRPGEEQEVLKEFSNLLSNHRFLIHFNGSTFDVPYLMHKYTLYQQDQSWEHLTQIDLYQRLLPYKKILHMDHMRQKDLEQRMGLLRKDRYSGGELIPIYQEYLTSCDENLLHLLLLHNEEDMKGMVQLLPLLAIPRLFDGTLLGNHLEGELTEDLCRIKADFTQPLPFSLECSTEHYTVQAQPDHCTFTVPLQEATRKLYYPNYKDYYYLPLEDEAIHKSVAIYVDKDHRVRAKADTCYKKVTGRFLPQYGELYTPAFHETLREKQSWFLPDETFLERKESLRTYTIQLLSHCR